MISIKNYTEFEAKISLLYECIREEGDFIDFAWCTWLLYPYYLHFDDVINRYRSASLLAFLGLLMDWLDGSGFPFYRIRKELHDSHDFEKYMDAFMQHQITIKGEFPHIYSSIISALQNLISSEDIIATFLYVDQQKLRNFITFILSIENQERNMEFALVFEEAGVFKIC
ncbi:hypothetical protein [Paenibacillus glycanilyticus]|uniref:Uncharacterized protein n=1 Tax=Paenibacillus glycanilyticus TaxID=126569 RepID=A0ABQ6GAN9_9BACL|nr:hypothetical protein [Paenibacillus glycanilyticus]GLX68019.1 hypothetical protein MU1_23640 [Paenibacillus glycanilyticus]